MHRQYRVDVQVEPRGAAWAGSFATGDDGVSGVGPICESPTAALTRACEHARSTLDAYLASRLPEG